MTLDDALPAFGALSQETRLRVVMLLVRAGDAGASAGEVARHLGVAPNLLSAHFNVLTAAGLVASEKRGRSIIYRADFAALRGLVAFLTDECCRGLPEIVAEPTTGDSTRASQ